MNQMEQIVNRLVEMIQAEIKDFSYPDKVEIIDILLEVLPGVSVKYLMMEYGLMEEEDV